MIAPATDGCNAVFDQTSAGLSEFFPDNSPNRSCVDAFAGPTKVIPKRIIDHRLVAASGGVGSFPKRVEHGIVQVDRDPRLSWLPNHGAPLRPAEVVFFPHTGFSLVTLRREPRSCGCPRHGTCRPRRRPDRGHPVLPTRIVVRLRRTCLRVSARPGRRARLPHH